MERAIIETLLTYMEKKGINQNELAQMLGWTPPDLNDTLKGRKGIGKNRQAFLEDRLGESFKNELLFKINELYGIKKSQPPRVAEPPLEYVGGKGVVTNFEQKYVEKLLAIFRGINQQGKLAVKSTIDALYCYRKDRHNVTAHIKSTPKDLKKL
jgi:transcriptional regulator with XRE-family HTH domain